MESLKSLLKVLVDGEIDFIIIGGFAANIHGSTKVTYDIDICVRLGVDQIQKLRQCLAPYHPQHRQTPQKLSFLEFPEDVRGLKNIYLKTDLGVVDVLGELPGVGTFDELAGRADATEIFGKKIKVISIDDLIKAKKVVGRRKDMETILQLEVIKEKLRK